QRHRHRGQRAAGAPHRDGGRAGARPPSPPRAGILERDAPVTADHSRRGHRARLPHPGRALWPARQPRRAHRRPHRARPALRDPLGRGERGESRPSARARRGQSRCATSPGLPPRDPAAAPPGPLRRGAVRGDRVRQRVRRLAVRLHPRHRDPARGHVHLRRELHRSHDGGALHTLHRRHAHRRAADRPPPGALAHPAHRRRPVTAKTAAALEGAGKAYGSVRALAGIDLAVIEGELLALLGPSGCGKTTTLNVVAGFVQPDRGRVRIDGADVTARPAWQRGLGVVFQSYALFPHMTVAENVAFGLRERGADRAAIVQSVTDALALVRLDGVATLRPGQLSGGMQQRAALARALVIRPRVLLLDEPLAALDRKLREEMRTELKEIQRAVGITTLFVTHDQHEALGLSDRIAVMNRGRIEQLGAPREVYERPATRFVADFIGASSVLRARATAADRATVAGIGLRVTGTALPAGDVELAVRPERVRLTAASGDNVLAA